MWRVLKYLTITKVDGYFLKNCYFRKILKKTRFKFKSWMTKYNRWLKCVFSIEVDINLTRYKMKKFDNSSDKNFVSVLYKNSVYNVIWRRIARKIYRSLIQFFRTRIHPSSRPNYLILRRLWMKKTFYVW